MKKIIFLFILLGFNFLNAQCEIGFEEILRNSVKNSSDFDTFALSHNYTLDSQTKTYFCDYNLELPSLLRRYLEGSIMNVNYSTYSKKSYLEIKSTMQRMGFKYDGTQNNGNMVMYEYTANNIWVRLTEETRDLNTNYLMTIKIDLSDK